LADRNMTVNQIGIERASANGDVIEYHSGQ